MRIHRGRILQASLLASLAATAGFAEEPRSAPQPQAPGALTAESPRQGLDDGRSQPLFGKITAIENGKLELAKLDGTTVAVKLSDKTEFRKDRQSAKLGDFKVGDMVFVRAEEGADHSVTALLVGGRTGSGPGGAGMGIIGTGGEMGELGKDFVAGEVKSVAAPQLTVLRPDNVTQTLELNEETSLRKGHESVTIMDIQPGDHVFVRGRTQNNVFVPRTVMVIGAEQWKRMQDMGMTPGVNKPAADPHSKPPQQ